MTQDDIIRMARNSGMAYEEDSDRYIANIDDLQDFAQLVAAAEREACAKIADRHSTCTNDTPDVIAIAIRARGQQ